MTGRTPRAARWAVAIGAAALLFTVLGRLPLLDPDEGRYARTSQLMLERGDLVVPWFEGRPRLEKPAFFYWMEAAAFSALGFTETAARLPSAAAAAGTLLWLFLFARRRAGETTALAACAICATTPLFLALGRTATTDMTLTFFVFGASASLYAGIVEPGGRRVHLWIAGLCLGLGMLTKGPAVLPVPALVVAAGAVARRRAPITVAGKLVGVAWIMVAVALPWAVLLFHRVGWEPALEIWRREAIERLGSGLDHPESPLYLFMTAPVTFFPWSAFVPSAIASALRRLKRGDAWGPVLLAWSVGPFLFWTFSRGKLDSYLLPIAPAVALLIATALFREPGAEPARHLRWAIWILTAIGSLALLPFPITRMVRSAPAALPSVALIAGACALVLALIAFSGRYRAAAPALAALLGCALLAAFVTLPVSWADARSGRALARETAGADLDGPLYVHRLLMPSLSFYLDREPESVESRRVLLGLAGGGGPATVILDERRRRAVSGLQDLGFHPLARNAGRVMMRRGGTEEGAPGGGA